MGPLGSAVAAVKSIAVVSTTFFATVKQINSEYVKKYYGVSDTSRDDAINKFEKICSDAHSAKKLIKSIVKDYHKPSANSKSASCDLFDHLKDKGRRTNRKCNDIAKYLAEAEQGRMLSVLERNIDGFDMPDNRLEH